MYDPSQQSSGPAAGHEVCQRHLKYLFIIRLYHCQHQCKYQCKTSKYESDVSFTHLGTLFINGYIYNGLSMVPQSCVVSFPFPPIPPTLVSVAPSFSMMPCGTVITSLVAGPSVSSSIYPHSIPESFPSCISIIYYLLCVGCASIVYCGHLL